MYDSLNSYDWKGNGETAFNSSNFIGISSVAEKFYELNQEVGIAGEYTYARDPSTLSENERLNQLMLCMPSLIEITQHDMTQKYLPEFSDNEARDAIDKTDTVNLNHIIEVNQFGFLPSNLSQLLYYMDYEGIADILNLKTQGVKDIKAQYNDGTLIAGTTRRHDAYIKLLVTDKTNNKYLYHITPTNTKALKCDYDFIKYIYDRTFCLYWPSTYRTEVVHPQTSQQDNYVKISAKGSQGTCFIIDRVENKALEQQNKYEFLVGSNAHVLNLAPGFNKSKRMAGYSLWNPQEYIGGKVNKTYDKYWDGGWETKKYVDSSVPSNIQEKITMVNGNTTYTKHNEITQRYPNYTYASIPPNSGATSV